MDGMKELTLEGINRGAAEELFQRELKAVLQNINDPSTKADGARTITIEIAIKPNMEREMGVLEVKAKSKLEPARSTGSTFVLVEEGNELNLWEPDIHQPGLQFDNVRGIDNKTKAAGDYD